MIGPIIALLTFAGAPAALAQTYDISQMVTDYERPYIYAIDPGSGSSNDALLLFIHTETEQIEKVIPIGTNPTDMTIHYGEDRLYVTNWEGGYTRIVDLATQEQIAPLPLGTDVYKINAGRPGRIYYEEEDGAIDVLIVDTTTGAIVGELKTAPPAPYSIREGDGEIDPTGSYYYHCDNNSSSAGITKYDISTDASVVLGTSPMHSSGSRNLVLSGDGSRLFWQGYVYDADLIELGHLGEEIYATSLHGDLAFGSSQVYNARTGEAIYTLPVVTSVLAVSGDQSKLFYFEPGTHHIGVIGVSEIADIPGPGLNPEPADGSTQVLPLGQLSWALSPLALSYRVYFGTDPAAVASADPASAEFLGEVSTNSIPLPVDLIPGQTYYWRVDLVGFAGTTAGPVWSVTAAPITIAPNELSTVLATSLPPQQQRSLTLTAPGSSLAWSVSEDIAWLSVSHAAGTTPDELVVTFDASGLPIGDYAGELRFESGSYSFAVPVSLDLFEMDLTQMVTDHERPYVYALHRGSGSFDKAFLLFIHTETEQIEKVIPIGTNPTDMTIHYGEGRLYVTNWRDAYIRVVDLATQEEIAPLSLGTNVYKINAGRPGRIYYEEEETWIDVPIVDTTTGAIVGELALFPISGGDGEIDPTGHYYYHCGDNMSSVEIAKYDISTDAPVILGTSLEHHPYGSRNLVMSGDGSRLFWLGYIYDANLNELGYLGEEIYATSLHGDLAFGSSQVYDARTGEAIYTLPVVTSVLAVSGDQSKLFYFDPGTHHIGVIGVSEIADIPGPGLNPEPADGSTQVLPLGQLSWALSPLALSYRVYFGTDPAAVASADPASAEFLGEVSTNSIPLPVDLIPGQTYYWRVDLVGFAGTTAGPVWSVTAAPITIAPNELSTVLATSLPPQQQRSLTLTAPGSSLAWSVSEDIAWLSVSHAAGTTPDELVVTFDASGLPIGDYAGELRFESGSYSFAVPVSLDLFEMDLTQMVTDHERPYVYALHRGSGGFDKAFLLFIHTETEQIEKVIPIGTNPTDMTIHYGEGRLYITNFQGAYIRVVDLASQEEIAPLPLGKDAYKINAGRPGRIYYEEEDQGIDVLIVDTTTGAIVGELSTRTIWAGDGEIDPTGHYYYHCDSNSSRARITKYDISTDAPVVLAASLEHAHGSRNLVLSGDGSRLFWQGYVYDADLNELGYLGEQIYATNLHGDLAFGFDKIFDVQRLGPMFELPFSGPVLALSSDERVLFGFDAANHSLVSMRLDGDVLDPDADGLPTQHDNCPHVSNADQSDADLDRVGDACDPCLVDPLNDADGDGICGDVDICPDHDDPLQSDLDGDGAGDACDVDDEADGVLDLDDNCPLVANPDQVDGDGDTYGDVCDNCLSIPNSTSGLQGILDYLEAEHEAITALVPDRFEFSGGETGRMIPDGGSDMYDRGNELSTNLTFTVSYTNGAIVDSSSFGEGGRYATAKFPGLFVLAAENISIERFTISGGNGADGQGNADGTVLYPKGRNTLFVKRVYGASNPSINHLIIVPTIDTNVTHTFQEDTSRDFHRVSGLSGVQELFYLLVARSEGGYLRDHHALAIAEAFLDGFGQQDADGDGVGDACDLCPLIPNPDQSDTDTDGDGLINACDECPSDPHNDADGDGHCADVDNCPSIPNPDQADEIHPNGLGDACDDPDGDGVVDDLDNCADAANPDQLDAVHPNGVGDACDDPDGDGVFDDADNCTDAANGDQTNSDSDPVGDACDVCRFLPNPAQEESAACFEVAEDGGQCLEAAIDLVRGVDAGEIQLFALEPATPTRLVFDLLATSCSPSDDLSVALNGVEIGTTTIDPEQSCACDPDIETFEVSDRELLGENWLPAGPNALRTTFTPTDTAFAWIRVRVESDSESRTTCLYDHDGGNCDVTDLCDAGYTFDPFSVEAAVEPIIGRSLISSTPFEERELPGLLALEALPDGPGTVCVSTDLQPGLYGSSDSGEIFTIDVETGASASIGQLTFAASEIVFDPIAGRGFAQGPEGSFFGQSFSPKDGSMIGSVVETDASFTGLGYVGFNLYGASVDGSGAGSATLRLLDRDTGTSTLVGETGTGPIAGLAYHEAAGTLYGITSGSGLSELVTISISSGAAVTIASTGIDAGSLEFGSDGNLYAGGQGGDANRIFRIDRDTGTATLIASTGFGAVTGLMQVQAGPYVDCANFIKQGEEDLALNGAACGPPTADAGADLEVECAAPSSTPVVLSGAGSSDPNSTPGTNDDIVLFEWFEDLGLPSERLLGEGQTLETPLSLGEHAIALRVTDSFGSTDTDELIVSVLDRTAPTLSFSLSPASLWPPNHRLVPVSAAVTSEDACGASAVTLVSVTSSEPDNGMGDGNTTSDVQDVEEGTPDFEFLLRSERSGSGNGRRYQVVYQSTDSLGNTSQVTQFVTVAHDQGNDRDGDGLSDADEVSLHGTDPDNADSDSDGIADDVEVASGSDPLDATSPHGPELVPALGELGRLLVVGLILGTGAAARHRGGVRRVRQRVVPELRRPVSR